MPSYTPTSPFEIAYETILAAKIRELRDVAQERFAAETTAFELRFAKNPADAISWRAADLIRAQFTAVMFDRLLMFIDHDDRDCPISGAIDKVSNDLFRTVAAAARESRSTSTATRFVESCEAEAAMKMIDSSSFSSSSLRAIQEDARSHAMHEVAADQYRLLSSCRSDLRETAAKKERARTDAAIAKLDQGIDQLNVRLADAREGVEDTLRAAGYTGPID